MAPPPLRLIAPPARVAPPVRAERRPDAFGRCGNAACPWPIPYSDFLRRQNSIARRAEVDVLPYSDYLRGRQAASATRATDPGSAASPPDRSAAPARPAVPHLGDVSPTQPTRQELAVRTTYRVEVPLTSGRLIDIVW
ncbi:MAG: hypothetical protein ACF8R7_10225 [Phycisphaerales bacterium JB039]